MMLESRLILNVTVLASEPFDDLSNGHIVEDRMGGPKALASPPAGHDTATSFKRRLTPENNFVLVTSFDIVTICSLGGFSHYYDSFYVNFQLRQKNLRPVTFDPTYIRLKTFLQSAESSGLRPPNICLITRKKYSTRINLVIHGLSPTESADSLAPAPPVQ